MAQVIVLDYATCKVSIFIYDMEIYPEIDDLLHELHYDEKISDLDDCQWMTSNDEIEIEYETI